MNCKYSVILCLNLLIRLYLIKYVLICIYFEVTNLTIEKKQGLKLCLHFVEKTFSEGIMNISFCYPVNQKILSIALKIDFHPIFRHKISYKSGQE